MKLHLVSNTEKETKLVTIHELVVAREYYKFINKNFKVAIAIGEILLGGKGYTRSIEDEELLNKIRSVERSAVIAIP